MFGATGAFVAAVMGLALYWDLDDRCANSHLRNYLLSAICVGTGGFGVSCCKERPTLVLYYLIAAVYGVWGFIEAFGLTCERARGKLLWDMVTVVAFLSASVFIIMSARLWRSVAQKRIGW
jgi:nucleoside recognition membrane protein YjiH